LGQVSINLVVAGAVLITIEGRNVELDELRAYAETINYKIIATQI
jgi:hypothetical protein